MEVESTTRYLMFIEARSEDDARRLAKNMFKDRHDHMCIDDGDEEISYIGIDETQIDDLDWLHWDGEKGV